MPFKVEVTFYDYSIKRVFLKRVNKMDNEVKVISLQGMYYMNIIMDNEVVIVPLQCE